MSQRRRKRRRNAKSWALLIAMVVVFALLVFLLIKALGWVGDLIFGGTSAPDEESEPTTSSTAVERPGATTTTTTVTPATKYDDSGNLVVTAITLDTYNLTLEEGGRGIAWVTMTPEEAPDKGEIWTSSDPEVATVDDWGNITGVKAGTCVVTVKASANEAVSAQIKVTVAKPKERPVQVNYIQGILIANKTYPLPENYNPGADPDMLAAFATMKADAAKEGLTLTNSSDFRSYTLQADLYSRYVARDGQAAADTYSARPGHSEHQTGLAIDLNSIDDSFAATPEADWIAKNAHKYGFILRYPKGKEDITGYQYEPWHIRYLGVDNAKKVFDSGLTLEEYLGITSVYAD